MKIVTYNLRSGGRGREHWQRVRTGVAADLLLLQETEDPAAFFSTEPGMRCVWRAATSTMKPLTWGSAVLVRGAVRNCLHLPGFDGWVAGAEMDAPAKVADGQPLRVFSLHAPTRPGTSYVALVNEALDAIRPHAEGAQVIIGGDFNLAISEARAGTDRKPTKPEKAIHQRLRDELGLVNCWRLANPTAPLAQTLRWSRNPTIAFHIDGLFVPLGWSRHLRGCSVIAGDEWQRLSDHNPVVAEFDFA